MKNIVCTAIACLAILGSVQSAHAQQAGELVGFYNKCFTFSDRGICPITYKKLADISYEKPTLKTATYIDEANDIECTISNVNITQNAVTENVSCGEYTASIFHSITELGASVFRVVLTHVDIDGVVSSSSSVVEDSESFWDTIGSYLVSFADDFAQTLDDLSEINSDTNFSTYTNHGK